MVPSSGLELLLGNRGIGTENIGGGAQSGYFQNFYLFDGFFIAFSEIIGGANAAPPAPP